MNTGIFSPHLPNEQNYSIFPGGAGHQHPLLPVDKLLQGRVTICCMIALPQPQQAKNTGNSTLAQLVYRAEIPCWEK
jgi:hypothetical protein